MTMATPAQVAANWKNGMANSTDKLKQGINNVTEAPTQKAAARADAYLAGVQRAVTDRKWQAGLERVTLQDWKTAMLNKGVNRVATGAANAEGKFAEFMTQFLPFLAAGVSQLPPRGTIDQNIDRATRMMRYNAGFVRR